MATLRFKAEPSPRAEEPKPWRVTSQQMPEPGEPVSTHSYFSQIEGYFATGVEARAYIRKRQATFASQ